MDKESIASFINVALKFTQAIENISAQMYNKNELEKQKFEYQKRKDGYNATTGTFSKKE